MTGPSLNPTSGELEYNASENRFARRASSWFVGQMIQHAKDMNITTTTDSSVEPLKNKYEAVGSVDRKTYEEVLRQRQEEHLRSLKQHCDRNWRPCLHDSCPECVGTGIRRDGSACVHMISCPCPKCSPTC